MPTICHFSTLNSRLLNLNSTEQIENVYENKGSLWKSRVPMAGMAGRVPRSRATSGPESSPCGNGLAES
jgi:hypothetical protein